MPATSVIFPIPRLASLVADGEHHGAGLIEFIVHGVGKPGEEITTNTILIGRPHVSRVLKAINRLEHLCSKRVCGQRATIEIPKECRPNFGFGVGQYFDVEALQLSANRALASRQGAAAVSPARRASRLRSTSARQASLIEASSLPSRLSTSATTSADRSSGARSSAS